MQEWVRAEGTARRGDLRGPRRRRQGQHDQAGQRSTSTPRRADRGAARRRPSASEPSGTSSATSRTCRRPARSCCSTVSWYNRAGVERVMGFCTPMTSTAGSCTSARSSSGCWSRTGSCCASTGSRSATRSRSAGSGPGWTDPMRSWKLSTMDLESITPVGGVLPGQGRDVRAHRHPRGAVVCRGKRRQAPGPDEHDRTTCCPRMDYEEVAAPKLELPRRPASNGYIRPPRDTQRTCPTTPRACWAEEGAAAGCRRSGLASGAWHRCTTRSTTSRSRRRTWARHGRSSGRLRVGLQRLRAQVRRDPGPGR